MAILCFPKAGRRMQRTLKNLRVSLLCFLLTFLVLRNTIGAGKFGTPAQDFEEIRQHLHHVGLHRRHFRVLAEVVEDEKQRNAPSLTLEGKHRSAPLIAAEDGDEDDKQIRIPLPEEMARLRNAPLLALKEMQGNAAAMLTLDVKHRSPPFLTPSLLEESNVELQKDLEGSRLASRDGQRKIKEALVLSSYGDSRVLLVTGLQSTGRKNPAGGHFLLKSLKNKVDYITLHGLEISLSFGALDPRMAEPMSKLSLLQSSIVKYRHVEWLWWVPSEALITDMGFELPLQNYTESNLVLLGSDDLTYHQKGLINLNTDTFLIRNCQWSLDLLSKCVKMWKDRSRVETDILLTNSLIKRPHLEAGDESALIFFSNQEKKEWANKIHVENSVVLCAGWRNTALKFETMVKQTRRVIGDKRLPFVTHFLGCNLDHKVGDKEGGLCVKQMERALAFADKQVVQKSLASSKHSLI